MSQVPSKHITVPSDMNIINFAGSFSFIQGEFKILKALESGCVYILNSTEIGDIELREGNSLKLPEKLYDFEKDFRNQILTTLRSSKSGNNIGVLLEGYKGQGKSVIAKLLAIESELPVILITSKIYKTANVTQFLTRIKQDFVLLIDEFEKLFELVDSSEDKFHSQNTFLTLLDGVLGLDHKRLVIFTSNKEINDKFVNRPSRIRYYKKYNYMSKQVFEAIVADKLVNKSFKQDLEDNLDVPSCTIDILTTIIEEINIHDKPYSQFKDFFNHKEREITYFKYRKVGDIWEEEGELRSKREIGVESEYAANIIGYTARVISNDGETIIYEEDAYDEDGKKTGKDVFKLIKSEYGSRIRTRAFTV